MDINHIIGLYHKHGFFTDLEDDYILLRFKEDSKLNLIMKLIQSKQPLSFEKVKKEYVKFFEIGQKYNCYQYRIICTTGFSQEAKELSELNIALCGKEYINSLKGNTHIELYAHNDVTYQRIKSHFEQYNKIAVIQPTGTGKSLVIARLIMENLEKRLLVLTPSRFIITEIKKHLPKTDHVTFMTYVKAMLLEKNEIKQLKPDYIILDEFHRCGAEEWSTGVDTLLKNYPDIKILGTTATPIRYLDGARNMAEEIFENHIAQNLTLAKAIVTRILPSPKYISALYTFNDDYYSLKKKILKSTAHDKKLLLERLNKLKLDWEQSNGVPAILKKHISKDIHKIIVFCKDIKHLQKMKPIVLNWFNAAGIKDIHTYEIHSDAEAHNKALFEAFEHSKKNFDILFSVNMLNEGIHVKGVNCVILLRDTESPVIFFQQIGRCLKIDQNTEPLIIDLVNNFHNIRINDFIHDYILEKQIFYDRLGGLPYEEVDFNVIDEIKQIQDLYVELSNSIESWDIFIAELIKFKEIHGHCNVSSTYGDKWLASKVISVRRRINKGELSSEKVKELENLGFIAKPLDIRWGSFIKKLTEYKKMHGNCDVPVNYKDRSFMLRVYTMREKYRQGELSNDRIKQLESLGFAWSIIDKKWNSFIIALKEFKNAHGHYNVPYGSSLGTKVSNIREKYRKGKLQAERIKQLNDLGFTWNLLDADASWEIFISKLKAYKSLLGHCNIPANYDISAEYKIRHVRENYKNGSLSKERIKQLNELGFIWGIRDTSWKTFISKLTAFKKEHGHCLVPMKYEDKWFGYKVGTVRQQYKDGKLSEERIKQLNNLGFVWNVTNAKASWEIFISKLKAFKKKHGHSIVPLKIKDKWFGNKVARVRQQYVNGSLGEERIKQLEGLNFKFKVR